MMAVKGIKGRPAAVLMTGLTLGLVIGTVWFTKPWDDLQSWRWDTLPFESLRADLFTDWAVIQPQRSLHASSSPRTYAREVQPIDSIGYEWAGVLPRRVPSGTYFNHIATDTHVLSAVLSGAYNRPFIEIAQERLWERGGFAGDASWGVDAKGHPMGHCCLSVRLENFAHRGQLYIENMALNGLSSVAEDWFEMVEIPRHLSRRHLQRGG